MDPARPLDRSVPTAADFTADERRRAEAMRIRSVIRGAPVNLASGILGALLIAFGVDRDLAAQGASRWLLWCWYLALCAGLLHGVWIAWRFGHGQRSDDEVRAAGRQLMVNAVTCSVIWGASSWLLLPAPTLQGEAVVLIGMAMILMGGGGAQAIFRPYVRAFVFITVGLFVPGLLRLGDEFHLIFGLAFVLFAFAIVAFARTQEEAVASSILLGFRTEKLLAEITEQQHGTNRARHEAELANHAKNAFLVAAGHDLRQPMHALVQYFGQLQRRNRDDELGHTIVRIGKSLDAMQDLLNTILEVSKLMLGSVRPSVGLHRVSEVLDRIDAQMRPLADDKGLTFTTTVQDDCVLETDAVLLDRVVRNLVLNAIRYTGHGGVHVRARRRAGQALIQVFDSGIGIAAAQRERIFEAFYQVGNAARDPQKGLGLGLAIVAQLSELLAVRVRVRSKLGKGSVFTVTLNEAQRALPSAEQFSGPEHMRDYLRGAFVVLIDDNAQSLEATASSLAGFGCHVLPAVSGRHAVKCLQAQDLMPHLVISDYRLEDGETGLDAIRKVVDSQRERFGADFRIPAMVLSGDTAPTQIDIVQRAGFPLLLKPVSVDGLYRAANEQLRALSHEDT
jgi:two-component system, sensor histidine kinase